MQSASAAWRLWRVFITGIFLLVCVAPLCALLWQTLTPEGAWATLGKVLTESRQWRLLGTTLLVAGGTAIAATALGFVPGVMLAHLSFRWRAFLGVALAVPLLLPPYIVANAWVELLGTHGLLASVFHTLSSNPTAPQLPVFNLYNASGVVVVLALTYFPISAGCTALAWTRMDGRAVESARLHAGRWQCFWRIEWPLTANGVAVGFLSVFVLGLLSFTVPSLLQVPVYTVEIYTQFSSFYDTPSAMAQAMPLLLLGLAAAFLLRRRLSRQSAVGGSGRRRAARPRMAFMLGLAYCLALIAMATVLPVGIISWRAGDAAAIFAAWHSARDEIATSLLLSTLAASGAVLLGLAMARVERASIGRWPAKLFSMNAVPFLVSGPVFGVGLIHLWNHAPMMSRVYDSLAILVLACLGRYLFFAHLGLRAALTQLGHGPEDAAAVCGAGPVRRFFGILLPLLGPSLAGMWSLVFVLSLGELDAVVLVAPPGWTPLPVRVFSLLHYGPSQTVSALSLLSLLIMLLALGGYLGMLGALKRSRCVRD